MRTGRPIKPLEITAEERQKLELLARRPKSSQALAMRARIALNCASGLANDIAEPAGGAGTVGCGAGGAAATLPEQATAERVQEFCSTAGWKKRCAGRHA